MNYQRHIDYQNNYIFKEQSLFEQNSDLVINIEDTLSKTDLNYIKNILKSNNGNFGITIKCSNDIKKLLVAAIIECGDIIDTSDLNDIHIISRKHMKHLPSVEIRMIKTMLEFDKL